MTEQLYYAPARNYHGKVLVFVEGDATDTRGQRMIRVRAVVGNPWDDCSHGGWCPTNTRKFYPEQIEKADVSAPTLPTTVQNILNTRSIS